MMSSGFALEALVVLELDSEDETLERVSVRNTEGFAVGTGVVSAGGGSAAAPRSATGI